MDVKRTQSGDHTQRTQHAESTKKADKVTAAQTQGMQSGITKTTLVASRANFKVGRQSFSDTPPSNAKRVSQALTATPLASAEKKPRK